MPNLSQPFRAAKGAAMLPLLLPGMYRPAEGQNKGQVGLLPVPGMSYGDQAARRRSGEVSCMRGSLGPRLSLKGGI